MAAAVGRGSASGSWGQLKDSASRRNSRTTNKNKNKKGFRVSCVSSSTVSDPYKILRIHPGASQSEVKKAFRQLALQYHPDVCRGSNCGVQFHQINEAYDTAMSHLRGELNTVMCESYDVESDEPMREMYDEDLDWEEWMGWEGAGVRDYSSYINPHI